MDATDYRDALARFLAPLRDRAADQLSELRGAAVALGPDGISGVVLQVSVGQDPEGPFDVWAEFEGPQSFALHQRLGEERRIFGVVWTETGWEPDVPPCPRGWSLLDLEAAVLEVVAAWLDPVVPAGPLTWEVTSPEGTQDLIPLGTGH